MNTWCISRESKSIRSAYWMAAQVAMSLTHSVILSDDLSYIICMGISTICSPLESI